VIAEALPRTADVVVVGAGVVGAACALALGQAGLQVCVIDRAGPAAGSTSSGEGNLLVSDKLPGPELALALHSLGLWREFAARASVPFEFDAKGGLVVAASTIEPLGRLVAEQQAAGVDADLVAADELHDVEPMLAPDLGGGAYYRQDCQVQPMLAVRALLADAVRAGVAVVGATEAVSAERGPSGAIHAVRTNRGTVATERVLVAAGAWSGDVARSLGGKVGVVPRRGHVVVTEPLPPLVRHKVYEAGYVDDVESDDAALLSTAVVEGTPSGPILLGSSRELVGFDRRLSGAAISTIARGAAALFPFLRDVRAIRAYLGFRPASPDHLPIIGEGEAGLWYATGHEGAGIGLATGTADLIRSLMLGDTPALDPSAFSPLRPAVERGRDA
jgi:glycine/D-amino acid oxidase-like deaminating enzyme